MIKYISALLMLILLCACTAPQIKVPSDALRGTRKILVVPIEPPPLHLPPGGSSTAEIFRTAQGLSWIPDQSTQTIGNTGAMLFGILMLAKLPEAAQRSAKVSKNLEEMLSDEEAWIPTFVLAREVSNRITSLSSHDVVVAQNIYKIPGVERRENTWHMENWLGPIRNWYNQKNSPFNYTEQVFQKTDYVLEVGLLNYEIAPGNRLVVQVLLKLIDPRTGGVLGRTRNWAYPKYGAIQELFDNEGKGFKKLFTETGVILVAKSLKDIGMLSE